LGEIHLFRVKIPLYDEEIMSMRHNKNEIIGKLKDFFHNYLAADSHR